MYEVIMAALIIIHYRIKEEFSKPSKDFRNPLKSADHHFSREIYISLVQVLVYFLVRRKCSCHKENTQMFY